MNRTLSTLLAALALAGAASAQVLHMPDSTNNRLVSFSPVDGSLINSNVFALAGGTPISAIDVNGEVWVSEQIGDRISRWDISGTPLGAIGPTFTGGGLDNCRGIALVGSTVYCTNSGTQNGAPGNAMVLFDTAGNWLSSVPTTGTAPSPFAVMGFQGGILVASSSAGDDIHRFDLTVNSLGTFHNTTSLNFAQQMHVAADGNVLCAGFSSNNVVKLDANTGALITSFAASGARGVWQLQDGNILWSNGSGAHVYDVATLTSTLVYAGGGRHFALYGAGSSGPVVYCTAGVSTAGCVPAISASAQPSVTQANPCQIDVANVEGQKLGLIFYGVNNSGYTPAPWGSGTSFLCVKAPTQRAGSANSGGTLNACDGALSLDWNAFHTANPGALGNPFSAGDSVYVQGWYRDPPASKTTNLSDAVELTYVP